MTVVAKSEVPIIITLDGKQYAATIISAKTGD
jgi:PHD/YefM family antitoxin component YafN of YafNO toxin-antitoxin module